MAVVWVARRRDLARSCADKLLGEEKQGKILKYSESFEFSELPRIRGGWLGFFYSNRKWDGQRSIVLDKHFYPGRDVTSAWKIERREIHKVLKKLKLNKK